MNRASSVERAPCRIIEQKPFKRCADKLSEPSGSLSANRFSNAMAALRRCHPMLLATLYTGVMVTQIGSAYAADISAGQKAAAQCTVCHGKDGLATNPEAPNLAGESAIYIEKQLMAFKTGERQHRQMSLIAQNLDIDTIRDLAAWYQAMTVTVELPSLP